MRSLPIALPLVLGVRLAAAVAGEVHNGTTGKPAAGVEISLVKLDQGMIPVGSTKSDAAGKFRFEASIEGTHGLLRAQYQGVTYTEIVTPGSRTGDVQIHVYNASREPAAPESRVMLFEPSGREMFVRESYLFRNQSQPPVTYVGAGEGTLRFYLPPEAKGAVQASVAGIGGVPLRVTPEKTREANVFQIAYPIKPGESRVDLEYVVPYQSPLDLAGRTLYPDVGTRVAVPDGVKLEGAALQSMGQEPQTKAAIFNIAAADFRLKISGEGRLPRGNSEGGDEGGGSLAILPAAVHQQRWVIFGFAAAILGLGFWGLYAASGAAAPPQPQTSSKKASSKKRKS